MVLQCLNMWDGEDSDLEIVAYVRHGQGVGMWK